MSSHVTTTIRVRGSRRVTGDDQEARKALINALARDGYAALDLLQSVV